jgi:hypothetical protein
LRDELYRRIERWIFAKNYFFIFENEFNRWNIMRDESCKLMKSNPYL